MSDNLPDTPWGHLQRLKRMQDQGLVTETVEEEPAPAKPATERITKKKKKKKKAG